MDLFEVGEDRGLYYEGKSLTIRNGELRGIGALADALGINGLREMGFDIDKTNLKPPHLVDLMEKQEELPSTSDIANAENMELIKITRNASTSVENLIREMKETQTDESIENSLRDLLSLDKQLGKIRGELKLAVVKKLDVEEEIEKQKEKLAEIENPIEYTDDERKEIRNKIEDLTGGQTELNRSP